MTNARAVFLNEQRKNEQRKIAERAKKADKACWVDDYNEYGDFANCSDCGFQIDVHENRGYYNFCPHCGAYMFGGEEYI